MREGADSVQKDPSGLGQVHRGLWTDLHIAGFVKYIYKYMAFQAPRPYFMMPLSCIEDRLSLGHILLPVPGDVVIV
jgi:hypothetical protein